MEEELIYKEAVFLTLTAIFSLTFYFRVDVPSVYIGFILLSLTFYLITRAEEKKSKKKKLKDYFEHTSSHFALSAFFFAFSYFMLEKTINGFLFVILAIAVILFSLGFTHLVFKRLE